VHRLFDDSNDDRIGRLLQEHSLILTPLAAFTSAHT
jgi:hypothetical protein